MIGSPAHPAGHKSSVPGWCTSRPHATMQSNALARERRPLGSSPGGARHSPPKAGGGKDPDFRGGSPLGRNPGIQRHPDGCVVHAFRCASRSGAGPHRENWPEIGPVLPVGAPLPAAPSRWLAFLWGCIFTATGAGLQTGIARRSGDETVAGRRQSNGQFAPSNGQTGRRQVRMRKQPRRPFGITDVGRATAIAQQNHTMRHTDECRLAPKTSRPAASPGTRTPTAGEIPGIEPMRLLWRFL